MYSSLYVVGSMQYECYRLSDVVYISHFDPDLTRFITRTRTMHWKCVIYSSRVIILDINA